MIAFATVAFISVVMLFIINRDAVPGLADILCVTLGASLLAMLACAANVFNVHTIEFLSGAYLAGLILTIALAIGAFALMGYQNRTGSVILHGGYAAIAAVIVALSYFIGGDYSMYGAIFGACLPLCCLLLF